MSDKKIKLNKFKMGDWVITKQDLEHKCTEGHALLPKGNIACVCEVWDDKAVMLQVPCLEAFGGTCLIDCYSDQLELLDWDKFYKQYKVGDKVRTLYRIKLKDGSYIPWNTLAIIKSIKNDEAKIEIIHKGKPFYINFQLHHLNLAFMPEIKVWDQIINNFRVGDKVKPLCDMQNFPENTITIKRGTEGKVVEAHYDSISVEFIGSDNKPYKLFEWLDYFLPSKDFKDFNVSDIVELQKDLYKDGKLYCPKGTGGFIKSVDKYPIVIVEAVVGKPTDIKNFKMIKFECNIKDLKFIRNMHQS